MPPVDHRRPTDCSACLYVTLPRPGAQLSLPATHDAPWKCAARYDLWDAAVLLVCRIALEEQYMNQPVRDAKS